ncbi:NAD(P)H-quinone oxidoreductase [Balneolaceae bacterium YR4-1]|uniref:NAD(P)H-quinone oxidoreductase n=1 Tax=Halalkalibaculum roseum TaxID=2709311 RepID=A0A6M1SY51_9BACT|nr:NAD(P)H-quinone oxidoreductase [Halalkalibaculum roseum]NGP78030.1 NAD(P)H-quinone oxidoreductase [Halalkalibaculum roseum]
MKAIRVINKGESSSLEIKDYPTPEPKEHEIRVKIEATAINRADLHQRAGKYPPPEGASEILGLEMAGIVDKVGTKVKRWSKGDHVFGLLPGGGYCQYCTMHEDMAMPLPENLSFEEAAAVPETFLTAYQALSWLGNLQQLETVLIHAGGSGVGTSAIQLAKQLFSATIITTAGKQRKLETCRQLGAQYAYNYKEQDFAEEITNELGENAVNLVVDFIGAPYWEKNIEVLSMDGRLVYLSFLGGHRLERMSLSPLLKKRLKVMGSTLRSRSLEYKIELTQAFSSDCMRLLEEGSLGPVIDSVFDWEDTEEAHQRMEDNENTGKIVLTGM